MQFYINILDKCSVPKGARKSTTLFTKVKSLHQKMPFNIYINRVMEINLDMHKITKRFYKRCSISNALYFALQSILIRRSASVFVKTKRIFIFGAKLGQMMKFKYKLILSSCVCLFLLSCNNSSNQEEPQHVYADYYVRYLAPIQELKAQAQYTEGDDPQNAPPKVIKGGVVFLGKKMEMQALKKRQKRYALIDTTAFPPEIFFQYNIGDEIRREELSMQAIPSYSIAGPAEKGKGLTLITNDHILKGNESIVVLLTDIQNKAVSYTIHGPTTEPAHQIPPEVFQSLQPGPGSLYLVKRMKKTREQAIQTVTATFEYYTDTLSVLIQE